MDKNKLQKAQRIIDALFYDDKALTQWQHELLENVIQVAQTKLCQSDVNGSLQFSEREVDFAYLCGVFNTSGIDGLYTEIQRLKKLGKEPHNIIEA